MYTYKNLSSEQKFAVKTVLALVIIFVVFSIIKNQVPLVREGMMSSPDAYISDASTRSYADGASKEMAIDPIMPVPEPAPAPGTDAESYEVQDYFVSIETGNGERDCTILQSLKDREEVIFESMNESLYGCTVSFKVKKDSVDSVLSFLNELDPREVNETTYTIKREVSQLETQMDILKTKLAALDTALADALASFADVEAAARRSGDVASLAQVTDSKLNAIERINASRLEVTTELDRLERAKTETLDRMEYVYFSVNVYENEWVRGTDLKDSWVASVQELIRDLNGFLQDLSIGFVQFALTVVKYTLYASVLYIIARPVILRVRRTWMEIK
jgi:prefoldin subunit 5